MPLPPTLSLEAFQCNEMLASDCALLARPPGTPGAMVSAVATTLMETVAEVPVALRLSVATTFSACVPMAALLHARLYGAVVSRPRRTPST